MAVVDYVEGVGGGIAGDSRMERLNRLGSTGSMREGGKRVAESQGGDDGEFGGGQSVVDVVGSPTLQDRIPVSPRGTNTILEPAPYLAQPKYYLPNPTAARYA